MSGYTDVFIGLGTNDAQVSTSLAAFATDFALLLDRALAAGARAIVLLTPQFYSRAAAQIYGGFGQNSGGGSNIPTYRETIRRVVATYRDAGKPVAVVDAGKICGPSIARYLNWNADQNRVDPNVFDNILLAAAPEPKTLTHALGRRSGCRVSGRLCNQKRPRLPMGGTVS